MDQTKEELLAYAIAEELDDRNSYPLFLSYAQTYPEQFLKDTLAKVLSIPKEKIRKSRGALFTYLVEQHARNKRYYSRN